MINIPTSLRIAIGFITALWAVGLIALAIGAPGEIVLATAAIGTVGAFVEWSSHRPDGPPAMPPANEAGDLPVTVQMRYEADPEAEFRRKH
ncbi:hypothetical protein RPMA_14200 [Tardiphaga alba]|uniref:Uncharacterized protein n=1 Tax=Tardiphaga alba TaxID=340268 RepID=A0ABX8ADG6_9BRAD|nr:hypothetical protein [Tardiphaga alba]QUS39860.1 hypothetical protein RPMA_14200 [Tardiphaga alba]